MIDREKLIKGIRICMALHSNCGECPYNECEGFECITRLRTEALAILTEQEPTKPKLGGNAGPFGTQWYQCGACSGQIDPGDKYCRTCGREAKWDEA